MDSQEYFILIETIMQHVSLERESGQKAFCMDRMKKNCITKEMGKLGTEISPPICTSLGCQNGLDLDDWSESLDSHHIS